MHVREKLVNGLRCIGSDLHCQLLRKYARNPRREFQDTSFPKASGVQGVAVIVFINVR
jgi:hypothetical protein